MTINSASTSTSGANVSSLVGKSLTTICEGQVSDSTRSRRAKLPGAYSGTKDLTFSYSSADDDYVYYTAPAFYTNGSGSVSWGVGETIANGDASTSKTPHHTYNSSTKKHTYSVDVALTINGTSHSGSSSSKTYADDEWSSAAGAGIQQSHYNEAVANALAKFTYNDVASMVSMEEYSGERVYNIIFTPSTVGNGNITVHKAVPSRDQIMETSIGIKIPKTVKLEVNKTTNSNYTDIVKNNPNYSLAGTTFTVYYDGHIQNDKNGNHTITIDAEGNSNTLEFDSSWAGYTLQLRETKAGKGYKLLSSDIDVKLGNAGSTTTKEISNTPIVDPAMIQLQKESDLTKSADFNGTINPNGAVYTITQYMGEVSTSRPNATNEGRTWTYTTSTINGVAGKINTRLSPTSGTPYIVDGEITFPIGTYKIVETSVPKDASGTETGLKLSTTTYYVVISEQNDHYRKQIYVGNTLVYDVVWGSSPTVRNEDYIKSATIVDNVEVSVEEHESWYNIGVVKVDKTKADGGVTGVGTTPNKNVPQGDATFNGAQYYLYTTKNINDKFFSKSQNKQLYTLQSAGNNLWQVYNANGTPVVITTGNDGFGKTLSTLPFADCS